ncbi:MAG: STAS domain-containing protein [Spirochaetota bacterium]
MQLQIKKINNIIILPLTGRLDVQYSIQIEKEIYQLIQTEKDFHLLLNLADVKYMSSSGIRIFVSTMRILKETGRKLKLCSLSEPVKKIFEIVELLDMFEVYNTEDEAIRAF